jgi:hypothetical protein
MNDGGIVIGFAILLFAWMGMTAFIALYNGHMRRRLSKRIRWLRRERHALLLDRREVRNAARLLRERKASGEDEHLGDYDKARAADTQDRPIYSTTTIVAVGLEPPKQVKELHP